MGSILSALALALMLGTWVVYWSTVKAMRVPRRPVGHQTAMFIAIALAVVAQLPGDGALTVVMAGVAILGAAMFLFFTLNSGVPDKTPAVGVGQTILDFTAKDADGRDFHLSSLRGTPILLKFFRGHW